MMEVFFVCPSKSYQKDSIVYHEKPNRERGEEFFVFFGSRIDGFDESIRKIFRRIISLSRIGTIDSLFKEIVVIFKEEIGNERVDWLLNNYLVVVGVKRNNRVYILRLDNVALKAYDQNSLHIGGASERFERIHLSEGFKQVDMFEKSIEDVFVFEKMKSASGASTVIFLPSEEFYERNVERIKDTLFFPDFNPSKITQRSMEWVTNSFCGVHTGLVEKSSFERVAGIHRTRRISVPLVAGVLAAVIASFIFFYPTNKKKDVVVPADNEPLLVAKDRTEENENVKGSVVDIQGEDKAQFSKDIKSILLDKLWSVSFPKPVTSSPAVADDRVVFGCRDGKLYSFNLSGEKLWEYNSKSGIGASPAIVGDIVICANYAGRVFAVKLSNGEEVWVAETGEKIVSSPRVYGDRVYLGTVRGKFVAIDKDNGKLQWSKRLGIGIWGNACIGPDYIIVPTMDGYLVRLKKNGETLWKIKFSKGIYSSPLCIDEKDRVIFGCKDGYLYCYTLSRGKLLWKLRAGAEVNSPIVQTNGKIIFGSKSGYMFAVSLDGSELWRRLLSGPILSRPEIIDETVLVTNYGKELVALELNSGKVLRRFKASSPIYSSCCYSNNRVFFGSNGGTFYAVTMYDE